jgi:rusticyanin
MVTFSRTRSAFAAAAVVAAVGGGFAIAGCSSSPSSAVAQPPAASAPPAATPPPPTSAPAPFAPGYPGSLPSFQGGGNPGSYPTSSSNTGSPALAQTLGSRLGTELKGLAPQTVSIAETDKLGKQIPAGATVDKATKTVTFTGSQVSFTIVGVPPDGPDMTFQMAGLIDPAIVVPQNAQVTVQFINGDNDQAHGWMIVNEQPPFSFYQTTKSPAIPGAFSGLIGDPTSRGQGATAFSFQSGSAGTYQYICPMPGHAQMGMHGAFIVR